MSTAAAPDPAGRRTSNPSSPLFWQSPIRGPWLTSILGTLLVPTITVIALTGFIGHWAHHPNLPGDAVVNPGADIPVLFQFPAWWPSWGYALTEGTHVTLGLMTLPLILAKLWSVMPRLFRRPAVTSLAGLVERISLLILVASVLVEFATGILSSQDMSPASFNFLTVHYYGAWVFGTMFVLHAVLKLATVRRAYRERGVLKPLRQGLQQTKPEPLDVAGLVPLKPAAPTISRRGLLAIVGGASLTIFGVEAGQSIGGPLRSLALLAPRGRVFGTGPNDFQINVTATSAQVTRDMMGSGWRLTVRGTETVSLSREQLLAMPQYTRTLPIACTDGWSTTQHWTGVRLGDLARLVDAPEAPLLRATSLQAAGSANGQATLSNSQFSDERALLALRVNGVDISADHGYPARVIVPNVTGELNTKWVRELSFEES